jgi:plasmid stability protein
VVGDDSIIGQRCYHQRMKSVITRMDDDLHRALGARAKSEGRSVNSLINELLAQAVSTDDHRRALEARIRAAGLEVVVLPVGPPPTHAEVWAMTRGAGTIASEAIDAGRALR